VGEGGLVHVPDVPRLVHRDRLRRRAEADPPPQRVHRPPPPAARVEPGGPQTLACRGDLPGGGPNSDQVVLPAPARGAPEVGRDWGGRRCDENRSAVARLASAKRRAVGPSASTRTTASAQPEASSSGAVRQFSPGRTASSGPGGGVVTTGTPKA